MESSHGAVMRLIFILLLIFYATPSIVYAQAKQFIPKITDYSAFIELDTTYELDEDTVSGRTSKRTDLFLKQILDFSAMGYVYHPRFIVFSLRLGIGLKEEDFTSGGTSTYSTGTSDEYDFRAMVLPEHPYNLELFSFKLEPLAKGGFSSESSQSVSYSKGAIFRYKRKPYFLNVHYLNNSGESTSSTYETSKYGFLGTYYKERKGGNTYSFSASYDHQTSDSSGSSGTSNEAALTNSLALKLFRLSSGLTYHDSKQDSGVHQLSISGNGYSWTERGQVNLPWNLSADISSGLNKESVETSAPSMETTDVSNTTKSAAFSLRHKLYESLLSSYSLGYGSVDSESGGSSSLSQGLAFAYKKKIPGGLLRANFSISRSNNDSEGVLSIVNETHSSVQIPGRFTLDNDDVNIGTIIVWLRSPIVPGELVLLQQNVDYVITPFGKSAQIEIINLPAQFSVPGSYDFNVSYDLNKRNARFQTDNLSYSIGFDLFRGRFSPYYNHTETEQTLLEGSVDFVPVNMSTDAIGFLLTMRPFTLNAEYHKIDSNINPSKGWKADVNYNDNIFQNTQLQAGATYSSTEYPEGASQISDNGYTDKLWALSVGVQQRIPRRNMFLFLGGSYTQLEGLGETTTYSLNSSFVWKIGRLFITAGGNAGFSDSNINGIQNERSIQNYYLTVQRKLF